MRHARLGALTYVHVARPRAAPPVAASIPSFNSILVRRPPAGRVPGGMATRRRSLHAGWSWAPGHTRSRALFYRPSSLAPSIYKRRVGPTADPERGRNVKQVGTSTDHTRTHTFTDERATGPHTMTTVVSVLLAVVLLAIAVNAAPVPADTSSATYYYEPIVPYGPYPAPGYVVSTYLPKYTSYRIVRYQPRKTEYDEDKQYEEEEPKYYYGGKFQGNNYAYY